MSTSLHRTAAGMLLAAGAVLPAQAQDAIGFEGGTPFSPPAASAFLSVSTAGDVGVIDSGFGMLPTEGSQAALLTTFRDDEGGYPVGSPVFGGAGAVSPVTAWELANFGRPNPISPSFVSGSVLSFTVALELNETLAFDWNMLTSEPVGGDNDSAFVVARLESSNSSQTLELQAVLTGTFVSAPPMVAFFDSTSVEWQEFLFDATTAGNWVFTIGVFDSEADSVQSGLLIDRLRVIPEPSSFGLIAAFAAFALAALSRRRRA